MSSLLDLNMASMMVEDLNLEMAKQMGEITGIPPENCIRCLVLTSTGNNHTILFLGMRLWSSEAEQHYENIPVEKEMELNSRENFEIFVRKLIMDCLKPLGGIKMIKE